MILPLISMNLAKSHLRMTSNDLDGEIDTKIRLATAIVATHCKLTEIPASWISTTAPIPDVESDELVLSEDAGTSPPETLYIRVPGDMQAALLFVLEGLFNGVTDKSQLLSDTVKDLLTPFRDPTMA